MKQIIVENIGKYGNRAPDKSLVELYRKHINHCGKCQNKLSLQFLLLISIRCRMQFLCGKFTRFSKSVRKIFL